MFPRQGTGVGQWGRALLCALLPLAVMAAETPAWHLTVTGPNQTRLVQIDLPDDGRWCLVWNHSVQGFTVEDCFRVEQGRLLLDSSHQPDFAAGLGHTPGRGQMTSDDQHGYRIIDMQVPMPDNQLWLRIGAKRVDHRILTDTQEVSLSELAAGERVQIQLTAAVENGSTHP